MDSFLATVVTNLPLLEGLHTLGPRTVHLKCVALQTLDSPSWATCFTPSSIRNAAFSPAHRKLVKAHTPALSSSSVNSQLPLPSPQLLRLEAKFRPSVWQFPWLWALLAPPPASTLPENSVESFLHMVALKTPLSYSEDNVAISRDEANAQFLS